MYGYHGKALIVDLASRTHRWDAIPEDVLRSFIGGIGLGTYLLYQYCPAGADPLGPDNPLIFAASPLVGSRLTTSSKFAVMAKSPLTGFIGDSLSSSFLATELKKTCGDALVITGQAATPTLLYIREGHPQFLDASDLSGLGTFDTERVVKERLGDSSVRVACIGPAGENLVRYASIANDGGRQAGRSGPGAVMGSKRLKALALRGNRTVQVAQPEAARRYSIDLRPAQPGDRYRQVPQPRHYGQRVGVQPSGGAPYQEFPGVLLRRRRGSQRRTPAPGTLGEERPLRQLHHWL